MRLSELSTDRAADLLCEIVPYITNICADEELVAEIKKGINADEASTKAQLILLGVDKINKLVPIVLKTHRADAFAIIGALNDKTAEEIGKQTILKTMEQIRELAEDEELIAFFSSCVVSEGSE